MPFGGGPSFTPASLFAGGNNGSWFPQSDLSAFYTTNPGTTNIAANDDTIGVALDKHLMGTASASAFIAAQSELIPSFDLTTWNTAGGVTGATASTFTTSTTGGVYKALFEVGKTYKLRVAASASTSISWSVYNGTGGTPLYSASASSIDTTLIFTATAVELYIRIFTATTVTVTALSAKAIPGNHAAQTTGSFQPKLKTATGSRKYDGVDDCLIGTGKCGSGANSMAAKIIVPATLAATQIFAGLQASTSTRFYLAVNTSGNLCAGVGSDGSTVIVGTTDIRGLTGVAILIADGTTVKLYWNNNLEYSGAQNGSPSTSVAFYEGAVNNNGTATGFFAGELYDRVTRQSAFTDAERAQILTYWS